MGTTTAWTTMRNLTVGDIVLESDMDAIRTNLEAIRDGTYFEYICDYEDLGTVTYTTSGTTWTDVDATNMRTSFTTAGGPLFAFFAGWVHASTTRQCDVALGIDDTVVEPDYIFAKSYANHISTFVVVDTLVAGTYTVSLKFKAHTSGDVYIKNNYNTYEKDPIMFKVWSV